MSVSCDGIGVLVSGSAVGTGVSVSGIGVSVSGGVKVGIGVLVGTGVSVGMWVFVGMGVNVFDGICVGIEGICVGVRVATGGSPGPRVLVGGTFVRVGSTYTVDVLETPGTGENVKVGVAVGVNTYWEITSRVNAAIVFIFEKAESTTFCGAMETGCA